MIFIIPIFTKVKKFLKISLKNFMNVGKSYFDSINFNFINFVHKDFNINNLIYLPSRKDHLKNAVF